MLVHPPTAGVDKKYHCGEPVNLCAACMPSAHAFPRQKAAEAAHVTEYPRRSLSDTLLQASKQLQITTHNVAARLAQRQDHIVPRHVPRSAHPPTHPPIDTHRHPHPPTHPHMQTGVIIRLRDTGILQPCQLITAGVMSHEAGIGDVPGLLTGCEWHKQCVNPASWGATQVTLMIANVQSATQTEDGRA